MEELKEEAKDIEQKKEENKEINLKEERIRKITLSYYSRPDVRKAIFEFSKNRECVPRYFEGFGKRPDAFQYESDIIELAKKGATSFHCSEELWSEPLELSTGMKDEDIKKLRIGWDMVLDVDSKYLDYSKIYAEIVVDVLKAHGIKNIGVKFSGSKGWHIIVPWKAFPKEISGKKTSEMFPEWPRLICAYINSKISEELKKRVIDISKEHEEKILETYCANCNGNVEKKNKIYFKCYSCKTQMQNIESIFERKRKIRCPNCMIEMNEERREEILVCENCKINSSNNPSNFKQRVQSKHIDADIILVSPRHLFRAPFSLHEKTSLASVVIDADKIKDFQPKDADPLKIKVRNFIPDCEENEASMLLRSALEFRLPEDVKKIEENEKSKNKGDKKYKEINFKNINPSLYPQSINKILEGMKKDGRKRALFILLSFFKSLKFADEQIKEEIEKWNAKNAEPLKDGYIKAQLSWYAKNEAKLPPNFDKSYYKDIGIIPTQEELAAKNPVNYVARKMFFANRKN